MKDKTKINYKTASKVLKGLDEAFQDGEVLDLTKQLAPIMMPAIHQYITENYLKWFNMKKFHKDVADFTAKNFYKWLEIAKRNDRR